MFKKFFLVPSIAALLSFSTSDAFNPEDQNENLVYSALVENGFGWLTTTSKGGAKNNIHDKDFGISEGSARASVPLGSKFSTQLDLDGLLALNERKSDDEDSYLQNYFYITNHLNWRRPDCGVLGLLISYGEASGGADEEAQTWVFGAEGQYFCEDFTFCGQMGFMISDDEDEYSVITNAFWTRATTTYFCSEFQKISAELAYICGEQHRESGDPRPDMSGWSWGARYDRALDKGPLSFFASYFGTYLKNDGMGSGSASLTDHSILLGCTLSLGARNFRDERRRGAALDSPSRAMGRWTGWSLDVVN